MSRPPQVDHAKRRLALLPRVAFVLTGLLFVVVGGCADLAYLNSSAVITKKADFHDDDMWWIWLKNTYLYGGRDLLNPYRLSRTLGGPPDPAMDLDERGRVLSGSFYDHPRIAELSLEQLAQGQPEPGPPVGDLIVTKVKTSGVSPGFFGKDQRGVRYLVKFDSPAYPELGTSTEYIGGRITWLLGYHVPARYIITARVPSHAAFDGQRAVAVAFIDGEILGQFKFDKSRHRRAFRALGLASAWIDNTDMRDHNTLQVWRDGRMWYYLLDFNDSLGSYSSEPKMPWLGWRTRWDPFESPVDILTLGLWPRPHHQTEPILSPAVGRFRERFDPRRWTPSYPNKAFDEMGEEDGRWMAGLLREFTEPRLRAIVKGARYSRQEDEDHVVRILMARRDRILRDYP